MTLESNIQKFAPGELVTMFVIDLTSLGGEIFRITPGPLDGEIVQFDGNSYFPVPVDATGFAWNTKGSLPRPSLRISTLASLVNAAVVEFDDLLGGTVYRIRTFAEFLDNGSNPDPSATFPIDVYRVERKSNQNKVFIEWELSTYIDQEGLQLPRRQVLRDSCTHTYRFWDKALNQFSYVNVTCPYTGSASFDQNDVACNPALDVCSKKLSGCRKRFGENGILPTRAFPGVSRVRA